MYYISEEKFRKACSIIFFSFFLSSFLLFFFFTSTSLLASSVRPVKIIQTVLQGIDGAVVCDRTEVINPETAFGANTPTFFYRATNSVLLYSITTVECRSHQGLFAYITLWERDDGIRVYIYIYIDELIGNSNGRTVLERLFNRIIYIFIV